MATGWNLDGGNRAPMARFPENTNKNHRLNSMVRKE
jgi:hypothetical protein